MAWHKGYHNKKNGRDRYSNGPSMHRYIEVTPFLEGYDLNNLFGTTEHNRIAKRAMLASVNDEAQKTSRIIHVWSDGSCMNNGKRDSYGGWAILMETVLNDGSPHMKEYYGGEKPTTNNRMELLAVYTSLSKLRRNSKVVIHTDSKYLQNGICSWIHTWKKNGWVTSEGKPVKNKDLWMGLSQLLSKHTVAFTWTKGHANDVKNNRVDFLAKDAREKVFAGVLSPRRCHAVEQTEEGSCS